MKHPASLPGNMEVPKTAAVDTAMVQEDEEVWKSQNLLSVPQPCRDECKSC